MPIKPKRVGNPAGNREKKMKKNEKTLAIEAESLKVNIRLEVLAI
jgi:hypothetical protein